MTSASLFIESGQLAQAVDEFAKQLKVYVKAMETQRTFTVNAESDALLISFDVHVMLRNFTFYMQTSFIT